MPRKSAKQIVDEVIEKVKEETPKPKAKAAPKIETPQITEEHNRLCMTIVVPGSNCNCPVSLKK